MTNTIPSLVALTGKSLGSFTPVLPGQTTNGVTTAAYTESIRIDP